MISKSGNPEEVDETTLQYLKKQVLPGGDYNVTLYEQMQSKDVNKGQKRIDEDLAQVAEQFHRLCTADLGRRGICKLKTLLPERHNYLVQPANHGVDRTTRQFIEHPRHARRDQSS
jgi:hypothetical protein